VLGGPPVQVAVPEGFHKTGDYLTGEGPPVVQIYSDGLTTLVVYQRRDSVARPRKAASSSPPRPVRSGCNAWACVRSSTGLCR